MKKTQVTVRFPHGLHARPAACIVQLLKRFRCQVLLRAGSRVANAGSVLSILLLAATFNTQLEIQASGEDEDAAVRAAETFFQSDDEASIQQFENKPAAAKPPVTHS